MARKKGGGKSDHSPTSKENVQWLKDEYSKEKQHRKQETATQTPVKARAATASSNVVATPAKKRKAQGGSGSGGGSIGDGDNNDGGRKSSRRANVREAEGIRFRYVKPPPEEDMYDAEPDYKPRLFKWLIDNRFIEPVQSYRTVHSGKPRGRLKRGQ